MTTHVVLDTPALVLLATRCPTTGVAGPQDVPPKDAMELCLVRKGCFTYRDTRGRAFVDPTTCLLVAPGQAGEMTHPAAGGDLDTLLFLRPETLAAVSEPLAAAATVVPLTARVTPDMHVTQLRLLAASRAGADPLRLQELTLELLVAVLGQVGGTRVLAGRPATVRARRQLAEDARVLLADDGEAPDVVRLAGRLGCSPHHLSRVFAEHVGVGLGSYRTRLRLARAVELMGRGPTDTGTLADIAARCGFADHAHLSRTVRRHLDVVPARLRAELSAAC